MRGMTRTLLLLGILVMVGCGTASTGIGPDPACDTNTVELVPCVGADGHQQTRNGRPCFVCETGIVTIPVLGCVAPSAENYCATGTLTSPMQSCAACE
jgi:hypothetical protein